MKALTFQQESDENSQQPWPVVILASGQVAHGRPDAGTLIGFEAPDEHGTVKVWAEDAILNPEAAVGLYPVYSSTEPGGSVFSVTLAVREAREYSEDLAQQLARR